MRVILGLNAYHADSSACLLVDGELVAAAEEERFRRVKHWAGLPTEAIRFCLSEAGFSLADVDVVALNSDSRANLGAKLGFVFSKRPSPRLILEKLGIRRKRATVTDALANTLPHAVLGRGFRGRVVAVEHHLAHLASAFFPSPFDEALVMSVDGFGDFASTTWGTGRGNRIERDGQILFPHSLGLFYETITRFLGFKRYGDEYKVMGLASYGEPGYREEMRRIVRLAHDGRFDLDLDYFCHHREQVAFRWDGCEPRSRDFFSPALTKLLGPAREPQAPITQRHMDIARSAQQMYEDAMFSLLRRLHERHGLGALALAGGCAFNSVANGRIYSHTPIEQVYVQPAAGDAGGALGAALHVWHDEHPRAERSVMAHAYWGPGADANGIETLLDERHSALSDAGCQWQRLDDNELLPLVAARIAKGHVIGWFRGRMEWGPRALGNRSILCDPRRPDIKDILNAKIKRRESFRPFAPAVLAEAATDWFDCVDEVPFMMKVFPVREDKRTIIPAVTHVDGTGRLQTVREAHNPSFHRLIRAFESITGVPMLLNTSFNENEPIVCSPREALDCFLRTRMDLLVLGSHVVTRDERSRLASTGAAAEDIPTAS